MLASYIMNIQICCSRVGPRISLKVIFCVEILRLHWLFHQRYLSASKGLIG